MSQSSQEAYKFRPLSNRIITLELVWPHVLAACCNELRVYDFERSAVRGKRALLLSYRVFTSAHSIQGIRLIGRPQQQCYRLCVFGASQLIVLELQVACLPQIREITEVLHLPSWILDAVAICGFDAAGDDSQTDGNKTLLLALALATNCVSVLEFMSGTILQTVQHPETCTLFSAKLLSSRLACLKPADLEDAYSIPWANLLCIGGTQFGNALIWRPSKADSGFSENMCVVEGSRGGIYDIDIDVRCLVENGSHTHHLSIYTVSENRALNVFDSGTEDSDVLRLSNANFRHVTSSFGHAARVWRVRSLQRNSSLLRHVVTVGEDSQVLIWAIDDKQAVSKPEKCWKLPTSGIWSVVVAYHLLEPTYLIIGGADGSLWHVDLRAAYAAQPALVTSIALPSLTHSQQVGFDRISNSKEFARSLSFIFNRAVVFCTDSGLFGISDFDVDQDGEVQRIRVLSVDLRFRGYSTAAQSDVRCTTENQLTCLVSIGSASGLIKVLRFSSDARSCGRVQHETTIDSRMITEKVMSLCWKRFESEDLLFASALSGVVHCFSVLADDNLQQTQLLARFRFEIPQIARFRFLTAVELVKDNSGSLHIIGGDRSSYLHYYVRHGGCTDVLHPLMSHKAHSMTSVRSIMRLTNCACADVSDRALLLSTGCDGRLCEYALDCKARTLTLQCVHRPLRDHVAHAEWLERVVETRECGLLLLVAFHADHCQIHLYNLQSSRSILLSEIDCGGAHREFILHVAMVNRDIGTDAVSFSIAFVQRRKINVMRRIVVPEVQMMTDYSSHGGGQVWDVLELPIYNFSNELVASSAVVNNFHVVALACEDGLIRIVCFMEPKDGNTTEAKVSDAPEILSVDLCAIPGHSSAVKCLYLAQYSGASTANHDETCLMLLSGGAKAELLVHFVRIDRIALRRLLMSHWTEPDHVCTNLRHVVRCELIASSMLISESNSISTDSPFKSKHRRRGTTESRIMCLVSFRAQEDDAVTRLRSISEQPAFSSETTDGHELWVIAGMSDGSLGMLSLSYRFHWRLRLCACIKRHRHCVSSIQHVRASGHDLLLSANTSGTICVWHKLNDTLDLRFERRLFPCSIYSLDLKVSSSVVTTLTVAAGCDDGLPHVVLLRTDSALNGFNCCAITATSDQCTGAMGHVCAVTSVLLAADGYLLCASGDMRVSNWRMHRQQDRNDNSPGILAMQTLARTDEYQIGVADVQRLRALSGSGRCLILVGDGMGLLVH